MPVSNISSIGKHVQQAAEQAKRGPGRPKGSTNKLPSKKPPTIDIPNFDEWEDFLGTYVIRWLCRAYVALIFRGIDRDNLTEEEEEYLELDDEQAASVAKPFASMVLQSKTFNAKYGRSIMNSKDAIEASVVLFMWSGRVRKIAKKYKPRHAKPEGNQDVVNSRQDVPAESQNGQAQPNVSFANGYRPTGIGFN